MHIRRAVGAASLAFTVAATLSSCADNPKDKAFGGFGDAPPPPPTMPNPSQIPTGMPTGPGASGGTSGGSGPTARPTYDTNAMGEVIGQNCRYDRASSQMSYDVDIQNSATDASFRYSFTVVFKVGQYADSTVATKTIATRPNTVTVSAGGDRTVTTNTTYSTNEGLTYSCQVTTASKVPAY